MGDPTETWCRTALSGACPDRALNPPEGIELDSDMVDAHCLEEAQRIMCNSSDLRKHLNDEELAYPIADICDNLDGAIREWSEVRGLYPHLSKLIRACALLEKATLGIVNDDYLRDQIESDLIQDMKEAR